MEHLFVPYDLALKLKEKGFNECCFGFFDPLHNGLVIYNDERENLNSEMSWVSAPLYQQTVDWLREKPKTTTIQEQVI